MHPGHVLTRPLPPYLSRFWCLLQLCKQFWGGAVCQAVLQVEELLNTVFLVFLFVVTLLFLFLGHTLDTLLVVVNLWNTGSSLGTLLFQFIKRVLDLIFVIVIVFVFVFFLLLLLRSFWLFGGLFSFFYFLMLVANCQHIIESQLTSSSA